ncbi:MAG: YwqG family protein [Spirochaetota bacterium]
MQEILKNLLSFLAKIFPKIKENQKGLEVHIEDIESYQRPGLLLMHDSTNSFSKIGGMPNLPENLSWPMWQGKALSFICQIDLSEIKPKGTNLMLPEVGTLFFFYNQDLDTWGYNPKDKGSWSVLYSKKSRIDCKDSLPPKTLDRYGIYNSRFIKFKNIKKYPSSDEEKIESLELNEKQRNEYYKLIKSAYKNVPTHQVGGYALSIQNSSMDWECQIISNGIDNYGHPEWHESDKVKSLSPGKKDWVLLCQIDSDDELGMIWGDYGKLYFWIKKSDLKKKDFSNCWMILQC